MLYNYFDVGEWVLKMTKDYKGINIVFSRKVSLKDKLNKLVEEHARERTEEINFLNEFEKEENTIEFSEQNTLSFAKKNKIKKVLFIDQDLDYKIRLLEKIIKDRTNYAGGLKSSLMNILIRDALEGLEKENIFTDEAKQIQYLTKKFNE